MRRPVRRLSMRRPQGTVNVLVLALPREERTVVAHVVTPVLPHAAIGAHLLFRPEKRDRTPRFHLVHVARYGNPGHAAREEQRRRARSQAAQTHAAQAVYTGLQDW